MPRFHALTPVLLAAALALLAGCSDPDTPTVAEAPRPVKLHTVGDPMASQVREFPGRLKSPEEAQLSFRTGGELAQLRVREGQQVKRGELIAELDNTDQQLRLNDRQATFDLTRSQLDRMQQLVERQMVSRAEFDERQAQYNQAEAALNLARQDLAYTRLVAPFDGLVARTHVERYQVVQPNEPILTLYAGKSMDVVFQMPENLLATLRSGLRPTEYQPLVRMENFQGLEFPAVYKEHASQPDPQTLTYQVTLTIEPPEELVLLPGMSATVLVDFARLRQTQAGGVLVPVEAVFAPDSGSASDRQVWVVTEVDGQSRVQARRVEVGRLTRSGIEILSGLEPGEVIVVAGVGELAEGKAVRAWERERGL